jgi:hypothetical protein
MRDGGQFTDDTYLEIDADGSRGTPEATAKVLRSVAKTLEKSPDDRRYDFELVIDEKTVDADTD